MCGCLCPQCWPRRGHWWRLSGCWHDGRSNWSSRSGCKHHQKHEVHSQVYHAMGTHWPSSHNLLFFHSLCTPHDLVMHWLWSGVLCLLLLLVIFSVDCIQPVINIRSWTYLLRMCDFQLLLLHIHGSSARIPERFPYWDGLPITALMYHLSITALTYHLSITALTYHLSIIALMYNLSLPLGITSLPLPLHIISLSLPLRIIFLSLP